MEHVQENIFSSLTLNFPVLLPLLIKDGLQSHRVASDLRHQFSFIERQLGGQLVNGYASSLITLPVTNQGTQLSAINNTISSFSAKSSSKHPPLTASNSVANCNAASHLKSSLSREHRKLDRSISEPADKSQQQMLRNLPTNSSRYKTELCRPFEESGVCKYGDKCQFAHGQHELRTLTRHPKYKTELCRTFHSTGFCPYGPRCHFIHNSEDSKKCLLTTLQSNGNMSVNGNPCLSPPSLSPPLMSPNDICSFSLGSAGELSPTSSSNSSGSPTSSLGGFFLDDNHPTFSLPQVPHTAPPTVTSGGFFSADYVPLKPLSALSPILPQEDYMSSPSEDEVISSIDMLVSEMDLGDEVNSDADSPSKLEQSAAVDINRNLIRLPIFLSLGSSP